MYLNINVTLLFKLRVRTYICPNLLILFNVRTTKINMSVEREMCMYELTNLLHWSVIAVFLFTFV